MMISSIKRTGGKYDFLMENHDALAINLLAFFQGRRQQELTNSQCPSMTPWVFCCKVLPAVARQAQG